MSTDNAIINQRLRDFTVQIVDTDQDDYEIFGTGFAVDYHEAKFVTCAHVVSAILGSMTGTVYIRFPQARGDKKPILPAKVLAYFPDYDDDVALLQLVETAKMPLTREQIAVVGKAENSDGNDFRSYGFRRLGNYESGLAKGVIDGHIPAPEDENWCSEDVLQLDSANINQGMSGAALFDKAKNLVVGVISQTYYPDDTSKDRDTAFAVDARALSLAPLNLKLYDGDSYPRKPSAQPTQTAPPPVSVGDDLSRAPNVLDEWVGRADLLAELDRIYADKNNRMMGLVGFGGEGKTSLTRKWVQTILDDPTRKPDRTFWWAFYDNRNTDEFLESLLRYMAGDAFAQTIKSAYSRAQIIGAMMQEGRYLIVLDGFEVLQHPEGDDYGLIPNEAMREFLELCASQKSQSCCVITTRANLMDMQPFTTYEHVDITRLSEADGVALMREVGVVGDENAIKNVVNQWDGHALTLGLLGTYLVSKFGGDIIHIKNVPPPTADEPLYERVKRLLRRYDDHLSPKERTFMMIFCAFRIPVKPLSFVTVFRTPTTYTAPNAILANMSDDEFTALVENLRLRKLITASNTADGSLVYSTHPLIRAYYADALVGKKEAEIIHMTMFHQYEFEARQIPHKLLPTLDDLKPYIEMVHHLCRAGAYDEAIQIYAEHISKGNVFYLTQNLGAYEKSLEILSQFFPKGINEYPSVTDPYIQRNILNSIGFCYLNLGKLRDSLSFFERKITIAQRYHDYLNVCKGYQTLAEVYIFLGDLKKSYEFAIKSLDKSKKFKNQNDESLENYSFSLASLGWANYLSGRINGNRGASELFKQAETVERKYSIYKFMFSLRGIQYAECLRRTGNISYSRIITQQNLAISSGKTIADEVRCRRVLGDLDADEEQFDSAQTHYDEAIRIVRTIDKVDVRIEALLARGRFYAVHRKDAKSAFNDLNEALATAVRGEYRLYEADIRIALAWAHLATGDTYNAVNEANTARQMSADMGYHWGVVDAEDVLTHIKG